MKRKVIAAFLAATMVLGLAACGSSGGDSDGGSGGGSSSGSDGKTIRLVNGKIEIDGTLKKLAEMYKEESGVTVEIESMGGGVDIQGTIKGYYQAGNMPDIFVNALGPEFKNWSGMLVDMSDEKWAADTDNAYVDAEEGTIGYPYTVEAIGLACPYRPSSKDSQSALPSPLLSCSRQRMRFLPWNRISHSSPSGKPSALLPSKIPAKLRSSWPGCLHSHTGWQFYVIDSRSGCPAPPPQYG